jgi:hypothetical protein
MYQDSIVVGVVEAATEEVIGEAIAVVHDLIPFTIPH